MFERFTHKSMCCFLAVSVVALVLMTPTSAWSQMQVSGQWNSNIGRVYQIRQTGQSFTWTVQGVPERGSGTLRGNSVSASWTGGSGSGRVTASDGNRATKIQWNNGVVFFRAQVARPPTPLPDLRFDSASVSSNPPRVQFTLQNVGKAVSTPNCVIYVFSRLSQQTLNVAVRSIAPGQSQRFNVELPIDAVLRRADGNYGGTVVTLQIMHRAQEVSTRNNQASVTIPRPIVVPHVAIQEKPAIDVSKGQLHRRVLEFQHWAERDRTGDGWLRHLKIEKISSIAVAGDGRRNNASMQALIETLAKFDRLAEKSKYRNTLETEAFGNLYATLQEEVGSPQLIIGGAKPHVYPGGAELFLKSGPIRLYHEQLEVLPDAKEHDLTFWWDVTKVPNAGAVIWQVSRVCYPPFQGGHSDVEPIGLVAKDVGNGTVSSFRVNFATIAKEPGTPAGGKPNPFKAKKGNEGAVKAGLPKTGQKTPSVARPVLPVARYLQAGGSLVFYVRAIPVVSQENLKIAGQPSNVIRVFYGKMPKTGPEFVFTQEGLNPKVDYPPTAIRIVRFEYEAMKHYCNAHSNKDHCGTFKGGNKDLLLDFIEDAWDWTATAYDDLQNKVVSAVATSLNSLLTQLDDDLKIPESVIKSALQGAMMAAGIPPSIPNLDELVEQNADYLAAKIVEEAGVPGPLADKAQAEIKQALVSGAKSVGKQVKGSKGTPCDYVTDPPRFFVTIENVSDMVYHDVHVHLFPADLFEQRQRMIRALRPGERLTMPWVLPRSQAAKYWDGQKYSKQKWSQAYHNEAFKIAVYVKAKPSGSNLKFPMYVGTYNSPTRVWNKPFSDVEQ